MGERDGPRGDNPVSPELFAFVDEVAEEIASQDELQKTLDADEGLLLFAREFYVQFFENVLKAPITSISTKSGLRANRLMRSKKGDWDRPTQALVRRFQRLCKIYTELLGEQYESRSAIEDFQREFVLELLDEIVGWANEAEYDEIENAAGDSAVALRAAVEEVADEQGPGARLRAVNVIASVCAIRVPLDIDRRHSLARQARTRGLFASWLEGPHSKMAKAMDRDESTTAPARGSRGKSTANTLKVRASRGNSSCGATPAPPCGRAAVGSG